MRSFSCKSYFEKLGAQHSKQRSFGKLGALSQFQVWFWSCVIVLLLICLIKLWYFIWRVVNIGHKLSYWLKKIFWNILIFWEKSFRNRDESIFGPFMKPVDASTIDDGRKFSSSFYLSLQKLPFINWSATKSNPRHRIAFQHSNFQNLETEPYIEGDPSSVPVGLYLAQIDFCNNSISFSDMLLQLNQF